MSEATYEEQRADIDAQIAVLEAELADLKARRNELSIMGKLPLELLSQVFFQYQQLQGPNDLSWLKLTLVCRRWRDAALTSAVLWNIVSIDWRAQPPTSVSARSKYVPILLCGLITGWKRTLLADILELQSHRLGAIDLQTTEEDLQLFFRLARAPAPSLQSLSLQNLKKSPNELLRMDLFGGYTPGLRHLYLDKLTLDFRSSIFKDLATLHLGQRSDEKTRSSCCPLLNALEACPTLRTLSLVNTCPLPCVEGAASAFANYQPWMCWLHNLERLYIQDDLPECAHFLSHLHIAETVDKTFETYVYPDNAPDHGDYAQTLAPIITRAYADTNGPAPFLVIDDDNGRNGLVLLPRFSVKVAGFMRAERMISHVVSICAALPLQTITSLELRCSGWDGSHWEAAFSHAQSLKTVKVYGSAVGSLMAATYGRHSHQEADSTQDLSQGWKSSEGVPQSPNLVLSNVRVVTIASFGLYDLYESHHPSGMEALREWYQFMKTRPIPLARLVVQWDCGWQLAQLDDRDFNTLRQDGIVVDVSLNTN